MITLNSLLAPNRTVENILPTLIIDSREQMPLQFIHLPVVVSGLATRDYSVKGLENDFAVERKTLSDLYGSLTSGRDRFMRELQRMLAYPFRRLLIIGSEHEIEQGVSRHRAVNPKSILHSLAAIEARGSSVVFASSSSIAANLVERWAYWRTREFLRTAKNLLAVTLQD